MSARPAATFGELIAWGSAVLRATDTPRLDAELLLGFAAGASRSAVLAFPERPVSAAAEAVYRDAVRRRAEGIPLAYITGRKEFHAVSLEVTPDVLVPRPETELLVEEALERLPVAGGALLDLGTGSGAIALAVKRARPGATVTGVDASPAALAVARRNAQRLGLDVRWLLSDWFAALGGGERFDVIAVNPPYVRSDDEHFAGALRHEPRLALDGGPDGLGACRTILAGTRAHLAVGGVLLVEHGADQGRALAALAVRFGLEVAGARKDLAGHDRVVVVRAS